MLYCLKYALTMCSGDPPHAKKEQSTAVMPKAILERQKYSKTKNYIHEVKWHQKKMQCNTLVECGAFILITYFELANKKNQQDVLGVPVTIRTLLLTSSPSAEPAF